MILLSLKTVKLMANKKIIIIGGGPAGLMAAWQASQLGVEVTILEKNQQCGLKLLMTGGGRCNLTNLQDNRQLAAAFGSNGAWLLSSLSRFSAAETVDFFNSLKIKTKIETGNRVFPESNSAKEVLTVFLDSLTKHNVKIINSATVADFIIIKQKLAAVRLSDGRELRADNFIIATGGQSYGATGSSGDAYSWLKGFGHKITELYPGLTPIILNSSILSKLEGLSLPQVKLTVKTNQQKQMVIGPIIFTSRGISGPAVLDLSNLIIKDALARVISFDFLPELTKEELDQQLIANLIGKKTIKTVLVNFLNKVLPERGVAIALEILMIDSQRLANSISRIERLAIVDFLKSWQLRVAGFGDYDQAMITIGGVDLKEVDPKTMQSKIMDNLYLAGEVLDLAGLTGGYNLQVCWTTGYLAGEAAARP